jgi:hypothetical protein
VINPSFHFGVMSRHNCLSLTRRAARVRHMAIDDRNPWRDHLPRGLWEAA